MSTILAARHAVLPTATGLTVGPARVVVEDGWITDVLPGPPHPGDDDLGDHLLTPAFHAPHTHLALAALRGDTTGEAGAGNVVEDWFFRVEASMQPADIRAFTAVGAREALLHGVAVVWDHYYAADAVLDGLADAGIVGVVSPPLQDLSGPGRTRTEANLARTEALATASLPTGFGVALGPHATDTVSDALWAEVATLAARLDLPVHTHVGQSLDEVRRLAARCGRPPLTHLRSLGVLDHGPSWVLVHALFATDEDLAALGARHTLVSCPRAMAHAGFPSPVQRWERAGCRWVVAPDAPAGNDTVDCQAELAALTMLRTAHVPATGAMDAWQRSGALRDAEAVWDARSEAWQVGRHLADPQRLLARVWDLPGHLHPALPSGRIVPGHLAHLALWDLRHPAFWPHDPLRALALGHTTGALSQVMVSGRWRSERGAHGDLAFTDVAAEQRAEATARRDALFARIA